MLSRLLKRKPSATTARTSATPDGVIVWAIGDIHGRLDVLAPLVNEIARDAAANRSLRTVVVLLGDYVDRGPQSREVLDYLAGLRTSGPGAGLDCRFLLGNHEEKMLEFLADPSVGAQWCEYGGDATLMSYGLRPPALRHVAANWASLSADLDHLLPRDQREFLNALELSFEIGDYFFCHAGARPGEPLDRQDRRDLLWIRRSFLDSDHVFDRVVVHGHTPTTDVHLDHRRIGVDTKAYQSGRLSAVRLFGQQRTVVEAEVTPSGVRVGVAGSKALAVG